MLLLIETVYFYPVHFPGKPSCLCVRACHRQFSGLYFLDTQSFALCFFFSLSLLQGNRGGIIASVLQKYRLQFGGEKQFQTSAFIRGVEVSRDREHARACVNREPLAALVSGHSPICFQLGDSSLGKTEKLNSPVIPQMPRHGHAPPPKLQTCGRPASSGMCVVGMVGPFIYLMATVALRYACLSPRLCSLRQPPGPRGWGD